MPVVVATKAPRCLASWMARVPTPPEPAWISTFWPFFNLAVSTRTCQAVSAARGMEAASSMLMFWGFNASESSFNAISSAKVPMRS
ncbi:hypothetical protein FQZ97_1231990 [compost metagenome]